MDSLAGRWRSYLTAERAADIDAVGEAGPSPQSVTIDLIELYRTDEDLAEAILAHPDRVLSEARTALDDLVDAPAPVQLQVENNPHLCGVSEVSARQFHELVTIDGVVDAVGPINASPVTARYTCPACGASISTSPAGIEPKEPVRCDGCEWDGRFEFRPNDSAFVDTQRLTLAPDPGARDGPRRAGPLPAYVSGDLAGEAREGDHVGVTGILRVRHRTEPPLYSPYLDGLGLRDERDVSPPDSLEAALESYWEAASSTPRATDEGPGAGRLGE